ncbi:DEAD/DEAH box helicase [Botryobacter ruber]|uniref:DEAD/DEAH box helicase n=1 Tax=Botryobacter ruber TaxID=2171629 RepID=UPI000E0A58F2|nr:DEAD/DEAH box helicase [Botryobacter ruber]
MAKDMPSIFDRLQKKTVAPPKAKKAPDVFFRLNFDAFGAYITTTDATGATVEPDYRSYSGAVRDVLRSIDSIREHNDFVIDWEKPSDNIYLAEHDYLVRQLADCPNVVDRHGDPVTFKPDHGKLELELDETDTHITSKLQLEYEGEVLLVEQLLNENHVFAEGHVYEVLPVGDAFGNLPYFTTKVPKKELEKFLSLAFSYFDNLQVRYQDFQLVLGKEPLTAQPSLAFERIDPENSLYLRVTHTLPGFDIDLLDRYEISKVARLNEMEHAIVVRELAETDTDELLSEVTYMLRKHRKGRRGTNFEIDENLLIIPEDVAKEFIQKDLPLLLGKYALFGAEKLKEYKVRPVQPRLNVKLGSGIDFFEGDASLEIEGQEFNLFDAINQYRKNAYITLSDGTNAIINQAYIQKLERIFRKQKKGVKLSFFDLPLVEELLGEQLESQTFEKSREVFQGFNKLKDQKPKLPKVNAELRPYQVQGYKWLNYLHDTGLGGCLADDMGLGKTLQTITLLSKIYPKQKVSSLVVMPKSLLFNWENEVRKFNSAISTYTYYGSNRNLDEAMEHHLVLTTYAMVRNDIEAFKEREFYYVILDESQNVKNLQAQTTKAVMLLQSKHRLALSGTPIENNLGELYALFRFLNPAMFGSAEDFNEHYALPIQKDNDKDATEQLRRKIYPFILRRLKKNVLKELPAKMEQTLYVEMSNEQKKFYEQRRQYFYESINNQIEQNGVQKSQFFILQALSELRQIATIPESKTDGQIVSPKRELLIEQVLDAAANGHKVLVFANFIAAVEIIGEELENAGIDYVSMTGATRDRQVLVNRFQNDPVCKVFLMTLKTGGVGLNLTAADMVFIFDPWWNKAAENQAIDRTHRIGQQKTVMSYKLITKGTIEEKILLLQEQKKELVDSIVSSDSASIKSLNEQDVEFILGV